MYSVAYIGGGIRPWARPPFALTNAGLPLKFRKIYKKKHGFSFQRGSNPGRNLFFGGLLGNFVENYLKNFRACGAKMLGGSGFCLDPPLRKSLYMPLYVLKIKYTYIFFCR